MSHFIPHASIRNIALSALALLLSSCANTSKTAVQGHSVEGSATLAGALPDPKSSLPGPVTTGGESGTIGGPDSIHGTDSGHIGSPASLAVSPPSYNFQARSVRSYTRVTFTITNTGGQYATGLSARGLSAPYSFVGGSFPGVGGTCSNTLAPQSSCSMIVTFSPATVGRYKFNGLYVDYNANPSINVPLDGAGTDIATLSLSNMVDENDHYNFGTLAYGGKVRHKFLLRYWGEVPATGVTFSGMSGPLSIVSNQCHAEVSADCELEVEYSGTVAGATQQKLKVTYNNSAFASETSQTLTGATTPEVTPAVLIITDNTTTHDWGNKLVNSTTDRTFYVNKTGSLPATQVAPVAFANPMFAFKGGSFPGTGGTCGSTITAQCTIVLSFHPSALGLATDQIALNYFDGMNSQIASLAIRGTGAKPASLSISANGGTDFGLIPVKGSTDKGFTFKNTPGSVDALNIQIQGVTAPFKVLSSCNTTKLTAGGSCSATVRFTPTDVGPVSGQITVLYFDGVQVQTVTLPMTGNGDAGALLKFTQSSIDFGSITIGTSQVIEIDVSYYGVLSGGNCVTTGVNPGTPGQGSGGGFYFPGGSYPGTGGTCLEQINSPCKIYVTFIPTETTTTTTTFTIFYDNGTGQQGSTSITLKGKGVASNPALLTFQPSVLDFGTRVVGSTTNQTVTVKRAGDLSATSLAVSGLSGDMQFAGGKFPGTGGTCGTTMTGTSCTLVLAYHPTVSGPNAQTLSLSYNDGIAVQQATLAVAANGVDAALVQAGAAHFGSVPVHDSRTLSFTLINNGTRPADSLSLSTGLNDPYSVVSHNCASTLAVGGSCQVNLKYAPSRPGYSSAAIAFNYDNGLTTVAGNAVIDGTGTVPVLVSANGNHSCARLEDGSLKCWGENNYGQLGLEDTVNRGDSNSQGHQMGASLKAVNLGSNRYATAVSVGYWHTCAVLDDGSLKCWGNNEYGQLGQGSAAKSIGGAVGEMGDRLSPVALGDNESVIAVSAGYTHTCALRADGKVKCFGYNGAGQLGLGDNLNRGSSPDSMGADLPAVDLGGWKARQISAGTGHTCALLENQTAKCWGNNLYGQLGQEDFLNRGDHPDQMGNALAAINVGSGRSVSQIQSGGGFTCALLDDGAVKCWGRNEDGILGANYCQDMAGNVGLCSDANYALALPGYGNSQGQMGDALRKINLGQDRKAVALASADSSSCALLDDGSLKCWGANDFGQLGTGSNAPQTGDAIAAVNLGTGLSALSFSVGNFHGCALVSATSLKCWGDNHFGELGIGDTSNRGDSANEMGDVLPYLSLR